MKVYRIVKDKIRTGDLSGSGAFKAGGRWNNKGTYMLYTSENSSLALLESLVHFDKSDFPPKLFVMEIEFKETAEIYTAEKKEYCKSWLQLERPENKKMGDKWMADKKYIGVRVKSAVNVSEHNILLNPLFPDYHSLTKVIRITEILIDERLVF